MTCDDVTPRLTAYVDGELDDATGSAVRGHLRTCAGCRAAADDELAVRDAMARLPVPDVPPALWQAVSAQLARHEVADSKRSRWWLWWQVARPKLVPAALVAAAAALAVTAWIRRDRGGDAPAPPPTPETAIVTPPAPAPLAIDDPKDKPSLRRDCDLHATSVEGDAATRAARMSAAIDRCYQAAADELLAMVAEDRPGWPVERAQVFDSELDTARRAVTTADAGRPRERAWQAVIQLLQRAVTPAIVAEVTR